MRLKTEPRLKFIVFVDDVLVMAQHPHLVSDTYHRFCEYLHSVGLSVNLGKVQQGRFAHDVADFCGWRFAGGYANISPHKIVAFKERISVAARYTPQPFTERAYIKKLNNLVSAFGHYYKYGNVAQTFEKLDGYVRARVRQQYRHLGLKYPDNNKLVSLGLFSLRDIYKGVKQNIVSQTNYRRIQEQYRGADNKSKAMPPGSMEALLGHLEHLGNQNKEIMGLMKKQIKILEKLVCVIDI